MCTVLGLNARLEIVVVAVVHAQVRLGQRQPVPCSGRVAYEEAERVIPVLEVAHRVVAILVRGVTVVRDRAAFTEGLVQQCSDLLDVVPEPAPDDGLARVLLQDVGQRIHPLGWEVHHLAVVCLEVAGQDLLHAQHLCDDGRRGDKLAAVQHGHGHGTDLLVHLELLVGQADVACGVDLLRQIEAVLLQHTEAVLIDPLGQLLEVPVSDDLLEGHRPHAPLLCHRVPVLERVEAVEAQGPRSEELELSKGIHRRLGDR